MKVIAKKIRYGEYAEGKMYCIKDDESYVFALDNYSWSLVVEDENEFEKRMKYDNYFQGFKEEVIQEMKEMIKGFSIRK